MCRPVFYANVSQIMFYLDKCLGIYAVDSLKKYIDNNNSQNLSVHFHISYFQRLKT